MHRKRPWPSRGLDASKLCHVRSWKGWEHHTCSFYICMVIAEDRRREDGRKDCEMFFVERTRIPEQVLPWKVLYELLRDKKENCATVLPPSPVQGEKDVTKWALERGEQRVREKCGHLGRDNKYVQSRVKCTALGWAFEVEDFRLHTVRAGNKWRLSVTAND